MAKDEIDKKMYKEKFPSMVEKGEIDLGEKKKKTSKKPMKEDRIKEGKKDKYRKMGFGKMMNSGEIKFAKGGIAKKNSSRMNDLEELGRVDSEKAYSSKGKKNLKAEKTRIVKSLNSRGAAKRGHGAEIK